ncbi:MAG: spermidine/putrescine ABC transporter substrate-binding protein [Butyribacter sp.]|nr:spermidine/putrescine ABC transporter substrate-binding protein [bacterium]MDY3854632.1 spermidine/putrescine ABC transporter substrate-binding protein [Butyribacter sp.]
MKFKKILAVMMTAVMAIGCLGGCGSSKKNSGKVDSINILVWEGTWSEEAFQDFEDETGIKVNVSYIDNTDTILSKLVEGSADYDVIDLETAYVKSFIDNDLLAKLDSSELDNKKNIIDNFPSPIGDDKMEYVCPDLAPGYTGIVYNKETCPIEITKFEDLADPKLKGQVAMINSTISLYGMALQALGYKADSKDEKEIEEANELLKKIKKNVKAFVGESAVSQLENGECSVAFCWDYMQLCMDSKDNWDKFDIVDVATGCERFTQYWAVPKSSEKLEAAEKFINFMLRPEEMAKCYTENGGIPLLKQEVIEKLLPEGYYDNPAIEKYKTLDKNAWCVAVNDEQISLMDTYYTELMGNE